MVQSCKIELLVSALVSGVQKQFCSSMLMDVDHQQGLGSAKLHTNLYCKIVIKNSSLLSLSLIKGAKIILSENLGKHKGSRIYITMTSRISPQIFWTLSCLLLFSTQDGQLKGGSVLFLVDVFEFEIDHCHYCNGPATKKVSQNFRQNYVFIFQNLTLPKVHSL